MAVTMKLAREDIDTPEKREKYTVSVVECGRVGLPTACLFAEVGFKVIGVDSNRRIVDLLKKGKSPFTEPQLRAFIEKQVKSSHFTVTTNARKAFSASDVIVINVPTPVDKKKKPDYSHIEKTCREIGMGLRSGSLIIFQSTMGPGITETLAKETLENASGLKAGIDFGLAYCPVCAVSRRTLEGITTRARVVGAIDQQSLEVACLLLGTITKGETVKVRDIKTAEAVELFKKAYRDVNVALANEFAHFCEKAGIDFVEACNTVNPQPHHCLQVPGIAEVHTPDDSLLLLEEAEAVNVKLRMLTLARKINDETLNHTIHLVRDALRSCQKPLRRAKISVFGVSSRPNMKEPRGSPTKKLVNTLKKRGVSVQVYDPFFSQMELSKMGYSAKATLTKTVEGADCIIIAVGHDRFRRLNLRRIKIFVKKPAAIVDMGHVVDPAKAEKEGFVYRGFGRGVWTR
ncbi:MAG: nucleotide sugar dehydrogenase [Candidatus Bathyarchaeota archaeon]|nr:nucleotide sugar dehydrogenase [Candidatus Bathyarchaeota archaeon]